jgi:hypothetical protein
MPLPWFPYALTAGGKSTEVRDCLKPLPFDTFLPRERDLWAEAAIWNVLFFASLVLYASAIA